MESTELSIPGSTGLLHAKLDLPGDKKIRHYAIFSHCFTCSSNLAIVRHISRTLTLQGVAVLRFDFTGLGESEGEFADSNFSGNVQDLIAAHQYLKENHGTAEIMIGHSLGGAATIMAASQLDDVKAVVTIGSPAEPAHLQHMFEENMDEIHAKGEAEVNIGGRPFKIKKQFLDDLISNPLAAIVKDLRRPLLILHSPQDKIVGIENAAKIYSAAMHPKSFISMDGADHLLTNKADAIYAAEMIGTWMRKYFPAEEITKPLSTQGEQVVAHLDLGNNFTTQIYTADHQLIADEPASVGGDDLGPSPYDLLNAGLGACTVMTLKLYAERKGWDLQDVKVYLSYDKKHADEIESVDHLEGKIDHIQKRIEITGNLDDVQRNKLVEIASKCPVHRTLISPTIIETEVY